MASIAKAEVHDENRLQGMFDLVIEGKELDRQELARRFDEWTNYEKELGSKQYKGPLYVSSILAEVSKSKDISVLDCGSGTGLVAEAITCVIPETSCEAERSFSAVRRHKTVLRSTMGEERLTALVLMNTYYNTPIDTDEVVRKFIEKHPRHKFRLIAKGFTNITGVDISKESIKVAEKKGIYKKIVLAFIGTDRMPFDDNEFDAIVCCSGVLPTHISPDAFREWVRILKPGGFFSFSIRRCYLEVRQGEEEFYSKPFADKIDEVLQDLEQNNKVEILPRREYPEYIENSPAYFYVIKVL